MSNIVRAFVVVLALTGAVASTQTSVASSARTIVASSEMRAIPIPSCPPNTNDPDPCHVSQAGR